MNKILSSLQNINVLNASLQIDVVNVYLLLVVADIAISPTANVSSKAVCVL